MQKSRLYFLAGTICFLGYVWIAWHLFDDSRIGSNQSFCFVKKISGIPCPSCGSTRSIFFVLHGNLKGALYINPLGLLSLFLMILIPFWIVYDILFRKETFFLSYRKIESFVRKKFIAIILISLVLLNWIWNIYKGI